MDRPISPETEPLPPLDAILRQSNLLRAEGNVEQTFTLLAEAEKNFPNSPKLPTERARLHHELGQYSEALQACWQALEIDARDIPARFMQGYTLFLLNQLEEASIVLDCLVAERPELPDAAWLRAGILLRRFGEHDACVQEAYQVALTADPANPYIQMEWADILRASGRYTEAREIFIQCLSPDICPDEEVRLEATFKLGCVAMVLGNPEEARTAFGSVLDIAPNYPDAQSLYDLLAP